MHVLRQTGNIIVPYKENCSHCNNQKKMKTRLVLASMGHRPELSINDRNVAFGLLEAGTCVADVARGFEGKENTIYCLQACF